MSRQLVNTEETEQKEIIKRRPGRPLSYRRKHLALAKDYLENYKELGDVIPSVAGLSAYLEKSEDAIYDWVKQDIDPKFSELIKRIRSVRHRDLLNGGLKGSMNPSITKLCLVSKHGYSENNQQDSGVTINVSRDSVQVSTRGQTIDVEPGE